MMSGFSGAKLINNPHSDCILVDGGPYSALDAIRYGFNNRQEENEKENGNII